MKDEFISNSEFETLKWAEELGKGAKRGTLFALSGELGTGKTIIAKGIAKGMGIQDDITSPTFLLLEVYDYDIPLYHFDLYRIDNKREFDHLNFDDYWYGNGISIIEWAEKAQDLLPDDSIRLKIEWLDENKRRIILEHPDN